MMCPLRVLPRVPPGSSLRPPCPRQSIAATVIPFATYPSRSVQSPELML